MYAEYFIITLTEAIALGEALPEKYFLVDNKTDLGTNLTVEQEAVKAAEAQKVIDGAINKVGALDATYSLLDTLNNIAGASAEVVEGATAYKLLDGVLVIEGPQTVALAQAEIAEGQALVNGAANASGIIYTPVYELADTLANLEKAPVLVEGATSYALTNEPGNLGVLTPEQIKIVEGASDASEYTWEIAPQKAEFTTQIDTIDVSAQAGEVTVKNGVQTGNVPNDSTYQTGDSVLGNGEKTIVELITTNGAAGAAVVTLTDVGRVEISAANGVGIPSTINASKWTNVGEAWVTNDGAAGDGATILNGSSATTYGVRDSAGATTYNVGIRAADLAGANTTVKLAASNAGSVNPANPLAATFNSTVAGVENIELTTAGVNNVVLTAIQAAATDASKLTILGDGEATVGTQGMVQLATVDASETTGNVVLNVGTSLNNNMSISGGTAADTLRVNNTAGLVAAGITMAGVETLRLDGNDAVAASTITFASAPTGLETIQMRNGAVGSATNLTTVGSPQVLEFRGDGLTANAAVAETFNITNIAGGWAGSADTLAVRFGNGGVAKTVANAWTTGLLTLNGAETVSISSVDGVAGANAVTIAGIADASLSTLNLTSATSGINVAAIGTAGANSITSVNASGMTGVGASNAFLDFTVNNVLSASTVFTAGSAGLVVETNAEALGDLITFSGAAGVDVLAASNVALPGGNVANATFLGSIVANLGAGNDAVSVNTAANPAQTANLTGGTGADVFQIDGGTAAQNAITDLGVGGADVLVINGGGVTAAVTANWTATAATQNGGALATAILNVANGINVDLDAVTGALGFTVNGATNAAASTIVGSDFTDNITMGNGNDIITGGGVAAAGTAANRDIINGGAGNDTYIITTAAQSTVNNAAAAATGFDIVSVTAGDVFQFNAAATAVVAAEMAIANPANGNGDSLLVSLAAGWVGAAGGAQAYQTAAGAQYLVYDLNGSGTITNDDVVVNLVGTVTGLTLNAGNVVIA